MPKLTMAVPIARSLVQAGEPQSGEQLEANVHWERRHGARLSGDPEVQKRFPTPLFTPEELA
jgi:hypothetical protein